MCGGDYFRPLPLALTTLNPKSLVGAGLGCVLTTERQLERTAKLTVRKRADLGRRRSPSLGISLALCVELLSESAAVKGRTVGVYGIRNDL